RRAPLPARPRRVAAVLPHAQDRARLRLRRRRPRRPDLEARGEPRRGAAAVGVRRREAADGEARGAHRGRPDGRLRRPRRPRGDRLPGQGGVLLSFSPLAGVRVVDVTTSYAGPTCTQLLGALGADVVKVEPPAGDEARLWGPPFAAAGPGTLFVAANSGKRSVAIDLRRGTEVLGRLVDNADVIVLSLRPGLAEE